jgi:hypothetical protein
MNKILLCLLLVLACTACNKPEEAPEPTPLPKKNVTQRASPSPTPANNWMWQNSKGKARDANPLGVKDNALEGTSKNKR